MDIDREYILTLEDQLNFQQYQIKMNTKKYSWINFIRWLIIYIPIIYIIFSTFYLIDYTVKRMGLIISGSLFLYYLLINIFSECINKRYLKKNYYNANDVSEKVNIKITEEFIKGNSQYSEYRIIPQWVYKFQENKDYIFLLNNKNEGLIIPKKYFSKEEIDIIKNIYGK
jgi:hypothetical protein